MTRVAGPSPLTTRHTLCASCSAEMPFGAKFCPSCGASRSGSIAVSEEQSNLRVSISIASGFKFGVGFALGGLVVGVVAWLLSLFILNATSGLLSGSTGASIFNGTGAARSQAVQLEGDVDVSWTADAPSAEDCRHRAAIHFDGRPNDREVVVDQQVSKAASGVYVLYGLAASQYILDVESTCQWSFRFKPRS